LFFLNVIDWFVIIILKNFNQNKTADCLLIKTNLMKDERTKKKPDKCYKSKIEMSILKALQCFKNTVALPHTSRINKKIISIK